MEQDINILKVYRGPYPPNIILGPPCRGGPPIPGGPPIGPIPGGPGGLMPGGPNIPGGPIIGLGGGANM